MNWLQEAFLEPTMLQAVIVISLVSAVGLFLGRQKIFGISLGITFVFFAGILAGHFGIVVNKDMLNFAQSFGLILFVYSLGLQVGPGFFSSLKKGGVAMNMMGLGVILLGLLMTLVFHWTTGVSLPNMVGLLCGAVTNTPALGAAQQALLQVEPADYKEVTDMALACAVAYPLGVVGVILAIILLKKVFGDKNLADDKERIGAFCFRRFGDGVVDFRLAAIEALNGDGVVRHQLNGLIFRQLHHAVDNAILRRIRFRRVFFIKVSRDAPVAAIAVVRRVDNIE